MDPAQADIFIVPIDFMCLVISMQVIDRVYRQVNVSVPDPAQGSNQLTVQSIRVMDVLNDTAEEIIQSDIYKLYHDDKEKPHIGICHGCLYKALPTLLSKHYKNHHPLQKDWQWLRYESWGDSKDVVVPYVPGTWKEISKLQNRFDYKLWAKKPKVLFGRCSIKWGPAFPRFEIVQYLPRSKYSDRFDVYLSSFRKDELPQEYEKQRGVTLPKFELRPIKDSTVYVEHMSASKFCINVRGDSCTSNRLYESIMAGCIPIVVGCQEKYLSADLQLRSKVLPFSAFNDSIPWDKFVFFLEDLKNISKLDAIIDRVTECPTLAQSILKEMERVSKILIWPEFSDKMIDLILQQTVLAANETKREQVNKVSE